MFYNCKTKDLEFVLYDNEPHTIDELKKDFGIDAEIELTETPDKSKLFVSLGELLLTNLGHFKKTALYKLGFNSFNELEYEYFLVQAKSSKLSASKRAMVQQIYSEIANLF